jgi:putative phosphoribosyl transferase
LHSREEGGMSTDAIVKLKSYPVVLGRERLEGEVAVPEGATGLVIFAHGSGSSRFSPRNLHVAHELQSRGLATLLLDLLTEQEDQHRSNVFDIPMLAGRLIEAIRYARFHAELTWFPLGLFGASGAARLLSPPRHHDIAAVVRAAGVRTWRARWRVRADAADRRRR